MLGQTPAAPGAGAGACAWWGRRKRYPPAQGPPALQAGGSLPPWGHGVVYTFQHAAVTVAGTACAAHPPAAWRGEPPTLQRCGDGTRLAPTPRSSYCTCMAQQCGATVAGQSERSQYGVGLQLRRAQQTCGCAPHPTEVQQPPPPTGSTPMPTPHTHRSTCGLLSRSLSNMARATT